MCLMVLGTYGSILIEIRPAVLPLYSIAQTHGQTDRRTDRFCDVLGSHVGSLDPKKGKNSILSSRHHNLFGWWKKSIKIGFGDPSVRLPVCAIEYNGKPPVGFGLKLNYLG